ncbi:MAG TPA: type II toxin-antitoxin system prevent-host-death family antitoxin [Solirubrobacteraceae bacterium]|nr:type II toxin-antitoxin system prevent-host-death family antitoxin [Solirubrobacteraceae bacterium]
MTDVSIRDLRNHGGAVVERATRGEAITITKAGQRVAELRPLARPGLAADLLIARWRGLPRVDPAALAADVDQLLEPTL